MKKIWFVSSGSYSDYHVDFACETKELAEACADKIHSGVEEAVFVESLDDVFNYTVYKVLIDGKGREIERWKEVSPSWVKEEDYAESWDGGRTDKMWAQSKRGYDVALKIARDKLGIKKYEEEA